MSRFLSTPPVNEVTQFCQRWKIHELAIFGSALRNDFSPSSDVDILVTFTPDADWGLLDHVRMELELQTLMNRKVNLITKCALERSSNWVLRSEILRTAPVSNNPKEAVRAFLKIKRYKPRHGTTRTLSVLSIGILRLFLKRFSKQAHQDLLKMLRRLFRGKGVIQWCLLPPKSLPLTLSISRK